MVVLDIRNSRMKDFYDLWYLARMQSFDLAALREAIESTFERRRTPLPDEMPFALTDGFLLDETKTTQWLGFVRRLRLDPETTRLQEVGKFIAQFLRPVLSERPSPRIWRANGPWSD